MTDIWGKGVMTILTRPVLLLHTGCLAPSRSLSLQACCRAVVFKLALTLMTTLPPPKKYIKYISHGDPGLTRAHKWNKSFTRTILTFTVSALFLWLVFILKKLLLWNNYRLIESCKNSTLKSSVYLMVTSCTTAILYQTQDSDMLVIYRFSRFYPVGSDGKVSACNERDQSLIPGLGRSPGEGNGNPLQYSCLENSMDRGA